MITFNMFGNREMKVKIDECTHVGVYAHTDRKGGREYKTESTGHIRVIVYFSRFNNLFFFLFLFFLLSLPSASTVVSLMLQAYLVI